MKSVNMADDTAKTTRLTTCHKYHYDNSADNDPETVQKWNKEEEDCGMAGMQGNNTVNLKNVMWDAVGEWGSVTLNKT